MESSARTSGCSGDERSPPDGGAHVGVAVDDPGHQHPARKIVLHGARRRGHLRPADLDDRSAPDHDDAGLDRRAGNRQDAGAPEDLNLVLRRGRWRGRQRGQRQDERGGEGMETLLHSRPAGYCPPAASSARAPPSMRGMEWCPSWQAYSHFSPSSIFIGTSNVHGALQVSSSLIVAW